MINLWLVEDKAGFDVKCVTHHKKVRNFYLLLIIFNKQDNKVFVIITAKLIVLSYFIQIYLSYVFITLIYLNNSYD